MPWRRSALQETGLPLLAAKTEGKAELGGEPDELRPARRAAGGFRYTPDADAQENYRSFFLQMKSRRLLSRTWMS